DARGIRRQVAAEDEELFLARARVTLDTVAAAEETRVERRLPGGVAALAVRAAHEVLAVLDAVGALGPGHGCRQRTRLGVRVEVRVTLQANARLRQLALHGRQR